jgi:hypothetical protein
MERGSALHAPQHSLSHLLITAASLACGYSASSIRERIYVTPAGSGILLYTGTPDAEGTLGGLVEIGRNLGEHLRAGVLVESASFTAALRSRFDGLVAAGRLTRVPGL